MVCRVLYNAGIAVNKIADQMAVAGSFTNTVDITIPYTDIKPHKTTPCKR